MIKNEINIFFTALMFYTRIPCPSWVGHNPEMLNRATRYFPLIGWIVAGIMFLTLFGFSQILPFPLAVLLGIFAGVFTTGAFHEDGLADVCDGFGGGWNKLQILEIMKDSRVGTYGALGLIIVFFLKFYSINYFEHINPLTLFLILLSAHSLSRWVSVTVMLTHDYVRENEQSKAKPLAKSLYKIDFIVASFLGLIPIFLLTIFTDWLLMCSLLPVFLVRFYLVRLFKKWIGGYTGDCLGAVQQLSELAFLLSLISLWKFI